MRKEPRRGGFRMGWDFSEIPGGIISSGRPPQSPAAPRGRSPRRGDFQMGAQQPSGRPPQSPRRPQRKEPQRGDFQMGARQRSGRPSQSRTAPRGRSPRRGDFQMGASQRSGRPLHLPQNYDHTAKLSISFIFSVENEEILRPEWREESFFP